MEKECVDHFYELWSLRPVCCLTCKGHNWTPDMWEVLEAGPKLGLAWGAGSSHMGLRSRVSPCFG